MIAGVWLGSRRAERGEESKLYQVCYFWSVIRKCVMNRRLEERDRFTAIGARRLKRITDKVIEEVFGGGGGKEKKKKVAQPRRM